MIDDLPSNFGIGVCINMMYMGNIWEVERFDKCHLLHRVTSTEGEDISQLPWIDTQWLNLVRIIHIYNESNLANSLQDLIDRMGLR